MSELREAIDERDVIDRLHKLRVLLPAMALETATARREAARLRTENRRLTRRLAELEEAAARVPSGRS
jgi:hypothetical protein